jgi:hypothetical protein
MLLNEYATDRVNQWLRKSGIKKWKCLQCGGEKTLPYAYRTMPVVDPPDASEGQGGGVSITCAVCGYVSFFSDAVMQIPPSPLTPAPPTP